MTSPALIIPPVTNEDRIRHENAVWRVGEPSRPCAPGVKVSVEYIGGGIEQTTFGSVVWPRVARWRWGWAPR